MLGSVQYAGIRGQLLRRWEAPQKNNANTTDFFSVWEEFVSEEEQVYSFYLLGTYFLIAFKDCWCRERFKSL